MIRNQWYIVFDSIQVPKGRFVTVKRMAEDLVFWRTAAGEVVCMHNKCPHLGARLGQGKLLDDAVRCPFHGFEYAKDGTCRYVPAVGKDGSFPKALQVKTYPTYEAHGYIWIWWGDSQPEKPVPAFYDDIGEGFSYSRFYQAWNVHYSRMIENQLDVMHLPFIHFNTIGRGGRMVVDGPLVKMEGDTLNLWVYNRLDDGTPPVKAELLPPPSRPPFLIFHFPNLWENRISDDIRILVAFVPVDDENSIMYGRFYQNVLRVPVLRDFFNLTGKWSSIVIANQDKRVVTHQTPKRTKLKDMGEIFLPGDRAILTYRTHRNKLKTAAGQKEE
ncbi:MAG TPA: aromatic ring-hydroxylating dioxygenase subunit alpha [Longilinea sp.]|nr:aromatic ring-hydroxylating dioxygenase subunit alpha [Longilinea sp.]